MGIPVEINNLMLGSLGGYTVGRSLRFRSSATAYLNRTPASASNQQKWTWSGWVKRGALGSYNPLFAADAGANRFYLLFDTTDQLRVDGNAVQIFSTTAVYRDPSAWYHVVLTVDTTQATAANRFSLYVNGVQVTSFATDNRASIAQNATLLVNAATTHNIARDTNTTTRLLDGYLAEVNFIDGQALTPSSFGAYDINGVWQPKKYSGTYGTNGFYLPFSNTSSTATLGNDFSGNSNTWTVNNISLTAGTTYDSMTDSPTVSASSSNYAVYNPLNVALSGATFSNGNMQMATSAAQNYGKPTIFPSSGKWYCEFTITAKANSTFNQYAIYINSSTDGIYAGYEQTGQFYNGSAWNGSAVYSAWAVNGVIGVALDLDSGTVRFYYNGTAQGTSTISIPTGNPTAPVVYSQVASNGIAVNFGQQPFVYTPPSGFKALNTYNLPAPSIANGAQYMAATLYTGNGGTQSPVNSQNNGGNNALGVTFQPDFLWGKSRSTVNNNVLVNSVVGANNFLLSNSTQAEITDSSVVTSLNSNGFTVGNNVLNVNASTQVAWQWKAGGTGVTNNSGTITSTVSANTTAGFSIVTFTGTGANATVGHGLGVAPQMIIVKVRNGVGGWPVYHSGLTSAAYLLELNTTGAQSSVPTAWNSTAPTSSVFSIGTAFNNGSTYVAYCFSAVRGYSAFGSYTGNGSADGPFIYTGFRPRFILLKNSGFDNSQSWVTYDTSRSTYNLDNITLSPNSSNAESTTFGADLDILSNGFKIRNSNTVSNANGTVIIYAAFAEVPYNFARAR